MVVSVLDGSSVDAGRAEVPLKKLVEGAEQDSVPEGARLKSSEGAGRAEGAERGSVPVDARLWSSEGARRAEVPQMKKPEGARLVSVDVTELPGGATQVSVNVAESSEVAGR
ncbi:hypothetical protein AAVH_28865 [Aphelenchoides avenae]|nr:hypothetical protein AAVH_28865 [Aphelenchus avenae]